MVINEPTIHQYYIKFQMKEIYKFESNVSPPLIDGMFLIRKNNLRFPKNYKQRKTW